MDKLLLSIYKVKPEVNIVSRIASNWNKSISNVVFWTKGHYDVFLFLVTETKKTF